MIIAFQMNFWLYLFKTIVNKKEMQQQQQNPGRLGHVPDDIQSAC